MDQDTSSAERSQKTPAMQQLLDDPFLLLFIGITVPTALYIVYRRR
jgi:hypothetical protein